MIVISDTTAITTLLKAGQAKQISSIRDWIQILESEGGLYLSDPVKAMALELAGEKWPPVNQ